MWFELPCCMLLALVRLLRKLWGLAGRREARRLGGRVIETRKIQKPEEEAGRQGWS